MSAARVLIVGGGLGGMEAATELKRRLQDRVAVTVLAPQERFLFRPGTVYLPFKEHVFGLGFPLRRALARGDIDLLPGRAVAMETGPVSVDAEVDGKRVRLHPDYVVLATGARTEPGMLPGFEGRVISPWTPEGMRLLGGGLRALVAKGGGKVLFLVPEGVLWPAPLYELAFLTHDWLLGVQARHSVGIRLRTAESAFLDRLGPRAHPELVHGLAARGIEAEAGWIPAYVEAGGVVSATGRQVSADLVVAVPPYRGTADLLGLPTDPLGFVRTEPDGSQRMALHDRVYVVGDAADFPVKQGELAMLQALAAADAIACELLDLSQRRPFRADSQVIIDRGSDALFVFAPLERTGDPVHPVRIRPGASYRYRVGEAGVWRLVKRGLRAGVNVRLRRGRPLHGGLLASARNVGTMVFSRFYAS